MPRQLETTHGIFGCFQVEQVILKSCKYINLQAYCVNNYAKNMLHIGFYIVIAYICSTFRRCLSPY